MTLRNNNWLPVSHVGDFAAKAFSSVLLHKLDSTEQVEVRNLKANRGLALQKCVDVLAWMAGKYGLKAVIRRFRSGISFLKMVQGRLCGQSCP